MLAELLKLGQAALASVVIQVANLLQSGGTLTGKMIGGWLLGALIIRVTGWLVGKYGPAPAPV
jgi:hypothetical protein